MKRRRRGVRPSVVPFIASALLSLLSLFISPSSLSRKKITYGRARDRYGSPLRPGKWPCFNLNFRQEGFFLTIASLSLSLHGAARQGGKGGKWGEKSPGGRWSMEWGREGGRNFLRSYEGSGGGGEKRPPTPTPDMQNRLKQFY